MLHAIMVSLACLLSNHLECTLYGKACELNNSYTLLDVLMIFGT